MQSFALLCSALLASPALCRSAPTRSRSSGDRPGLRTLHSPFTKLLRMTSTFPAFPTGNLAACSGQRRLMQDRCGCCMCHVRDCSVFHSKSAERRSWHSSDCCPIGVHSDGAGPISVRKWRRVPLSVPNWHVAGPTDHRSEQNRRCLCEKPSRALRQPCLASDLISDSPMLCPALSQRPPAHLTTSAHLCCTLETISSVSELSRTPATRTNAQKADNGREFCAHWQNATVASCLPPAVDPVEREGPAGPCEAPTWLWLWLPDPTAMISDKDYCNCRRSVVQMPSSRA